MLENTGERLILDQSWNLMTTMEHLHRYRVAAKLAEGKNVLDAACGTGYGTRMLAEKAKKVIGVDLNEDAIAYASEKYGTGMDNLEFMQMSVDKLCFPEASFDMIVSFETIEHIYQPQQVALLKSVSKLLKKDGIFLISTPNDQLMRDISRGNYVNQYHVTEFTETDFIAFLQEYFSSVTIYYQTVTEVSSIVTKGQCDHEGAFYPLIPENKMGRYYVAVCTNAPLDSELSLASVCLPDPQDYINERYMTKTARVFCDVGKGFTGEHFCSCSYVSKDGREFRCSFDLSSFDGLKKLRFDPCEHGGKIRIISVEGDIPDITLLPLNANRHEQGYDIFETIDPVYIVETSDDAVPRQLTICGEIEEKQDYEIFYLLKEETTRVQNENLQLQQIVVIREEELSNIRGYNSQLKEELNTIRRQNSHLEEETKDCILKIKDIEKMLESARKHGDLQYQDILYLKSECARRDEMIDRLLCSTSWKLTKPLRILGDFGRRAVRFFRRRDDTRPMLVRIITSSFVKHRLKRIDRFFEKYMSGFYTITFAKLKAKLRQHIIQKEVQCGTLLEETVNGYWIGEKPIPHEGYPLVSVIVPNYNHGAYLRERLDTVYGQDYPNFEVILLDDCSTDNSVEILQEYAVRYPEKTTTCFNDKNIGMVFRQWNKGIGLAKGKYIWIAESDDYSSLNFLSEMVPLFEYQSVQLAFARSIFIQDGRQIWSTEEYLADLPELKWDKPFMMAAHTAVNKGFAIKNIIPNVSSMMFRNIGQLPNDIEEMWGKVKLVGDWIFYLGIMRGGTISYTNKTTNYYRVHKESTSLKIQATNQYYIEQELISIRIVKYYNVSMDLFNIVLRNLEEHYKAIHKTNDASCVKTLYCLDEIEKAKKDYIPTIAMCCFALKIGGGETYPIYLANEMKKQGFSVSVLDFSMEEYDTRVRSLIQADVPLVEIADLAYIRRMIYQLGLDIIHSHHGSVDNILGMWLKTSEKKPKHIITLHGMYEAINKADREILLKNVYRSCSKFIYIADKNLSAFENHPEFSKDMFVKIGNGAPYYPIKPISRKEIGILDDAFVLCLVSRAIPEKGWKEAIDAVILANEQSKREIHLVLLGDGDIVDSLKIGRSPFVHFMGVKINTRDYFAMADMGFLPSRFRGESYPLVIIDSLMSGKPVLVSDIGEISAMITLPDGRMAGDIFQLNDWTIDVNILAGKIVRLAEDQAYYRQFADCVDEVAVNFNINKVSLKYLDIYRQVLQENIQI